MNAGSKFFLDYETRWLDRHHFTDLLKGSKRAMWVETIDGFIVNSGVLEKFEVELYERTATVKSKSEPIRINTDDLSPEEKDKLKEDLNTLMGHTKSIMRI